MAGIKTGGTNGSSKLTSQSDHSKGAGQQNRPAKRGFQRFIGRFGKRLDIKMAGEPGFEPRLAESESAVLPLNYSPKPFKNNILRGYINLRSALPNQFQRPLGWHHLGHCGRTAKSGIKTYWRFGSCRCARTLSAACRGARSRRYD